MSRGFSRLDNNYFYTNQSGLPGESAFPRAVSIWFRPVSVTGIHRIMGWTGSSNQSSGIYLSGSTCYLRNQGSDLGSPVDISLGTVSNNTWNHVYGYWGSYLNFRGRLNGGTVVSWGGTTGSHGDNTGLRLAAIYSNDSYCFSGQIAEMGIWNAELALTLQILLSKGILPYNIQKADLEGYYPIWGGEGGNEPDEPNLIGEKSDAYLRTLSYDLVLHDIHSPTLIFNDWFQGNAFILVVEQNISPLGIASAEALGSHSIGYIIEPDGIASAEAHGSPSLSYIVEPSGIASSEVMGEHTVSLEQQIVVFGVPSEEITGLPEISRGTVNITTFSIPSGEALGSPIITVEVIDLKPSGVASAEALGIPTLEYIIKPSGISSAETFGLPVLIPGNIDVSPDGIASAEIFGDVTLSVGNVNVTPSGILSAESLGIAVISTGNIAVEPSGIVSSEAHGALQITVGNVDIDPSGIVSEETHGSFVISTGNIDVAPAGIPGEEAFGDFDVLYGLIILQIPGIVSAETHGTFEIAVSSVNIDVFGIPSEEALANPIIAVGGVSISVNGIPSTEALGSPIINLIVFPNGIISAEDFGLPVITTGVVDISIPSISSAENLGNVIIRNLWVLDIPGIASLEALGSPTVSRFIKNQFMELMDVDLDDIYDEEDEFSESILYIHKNGLSYTLPAIFDNEFVEVRTQVHAGVLSREPMIMVKDRFKIRPTRGDKCVIRGTNYMIQTYESDGTGVASLILEYERTNYD